MSPILLLAGAIFTAALPLALIAVGLLHLAQAKVEAMSILDNLKTLLADLEALDFAAFVKKLQDDAAAAESSAVTAKTEITTEVEAVYNRLAEVVANVKAVMAPPAPEPVVQTADAPAPAA